jgi:tetratricopeptide (TPR) repeat protein
MTQHGETLNPDAIPVLEAYLAGRYQEGLEVYRRLEQPSVQAMAWTGQCLFNLDFFVEAIELLLRARALGFEDAGVFAATVMMYTQSFERASELLEEIDESKLTTYGRAALLRERGAKALADRHTSEAVRLLEQAWQIAAGDPLGQRLLPRYSQILGLALIELGRYSNAIRYLTSALETASPAQRGPLLLVRATALAHTGELTQANTDLETLKTLGDAANVRAAHQSFAQGVVAQVQGLPRQASEQYLEAASQAKLTGESETELHAELALSSILTAEGSVPVAQAHLSRARKLAENTAQKAMLGLRHGALLVREQHDDAMPVLEATLRLFEELEAEDSIGIMHLHLAEACLRNNQEYDALAHLARAVNARHALGNGTMFAVELRGLPAVFEFLSGQPRTSGLQPLLDDWRALELNAPAQVGLVTLGGYGLSLNGQPIKIESGTARTVELLAFLLDSGEASVENIITNVFDQVPVANARNSIHVIRGSIARTVPGLVIPHLKDKRKYTISHAGLRLNWDALEVKRALEIGGEVGVRRALALYTGPFLPNSQSEWAEIFRSELEFSVANLGLETVEDLYALERFEACVDLALRLLEVNVLNIGVSVMLVKATAQLKGAFAAREALDHVLKSFERGLGVVPELLRDLRLQPGLDLN